MRDRRKFIRGALLVVGIGVAVVGAMGVQEYLQREGLDDGVLNVASGTANLFAPGSWVTGRDLPPTLEFAQLIAPAVTAVALIELFRTTLEQQFRRRFARRRRNHVVLIGLGESGRLIAEQLDKEQTRTVIGVDRNDEPAATVLFDRSRWAVIVGDATDRTVLEAAGTRNAALVHIATGQDGIDVDVANQVRRVAENRTVDDPLEMKVQIDSSTLCRRLQRDELETPSSDNVAVEFVNMRGLTASAVLGFVAEAVSRSAGAALDHPLARQLRVAGETPLIHELGLLYARSHRARRMLGMPTICLRGPNAADASDDALETVSAAPPLQSVIVVQFADDARTIDEAAQLSAGHTGDLVVALSSTGSRPIRRERRADAGELLIVDPQHLVQVPEVLRFGSIELMARLIHLDYSRAQIADGAEESESTLPWAELNETYKRANRAQAFSFGEKLEAVGCELSDVRTDTAVFTDDEVELLARLEHERWMKDREEEGWRWAPERDNVQKHHPDLVDYADLSEGAKDKDRRTIERLPALAALIGLVVVRSA